jgi:hypothetical protein
MAETYTYEQLHDMTVAQMRDVARETEHDAVRGYSTMHKEQLLQALCEALGIEAHAHHEVVGLNKKKVKAKIRNLKKDRDAALEAHDSKRLKEVRREIHRLKRKIRAAMV